MADPITRTQLENASRDADDLGTFMTEPADYSSDGYFPTRVGGDIPTLRKQLSLIPATGYIARATWAELLAEVDDWPTETVAVVPTSDGGTHSAGAVQNAGVYRRSDSDPTGWLWLFSTAELAISVDEAQLAATQAIEARDTTLTVANAPIAVGRPLASVLVSGSASTNSTRVFNTPVAHDITFNRLRIRTAANTAFTLKFRRFVSPTGVQVPDDGEPGSAGHDVAVLIPAQGVGGGYVEIVFASIGNVGEYIGFYGPANMFMTAPATGDEGGYYSKVGDVTDMSGAALSTTTQLQISFEGTYQAVTGPEFQAVQARLTATEVQTVKVPALESQNNAEPVGDIWDFDGMNIPASRIYSGVNPLVAASNDHRNMLIYGDLTVLREGPATSGGNLARYILAVDVSTWTDGEIATMHLFCRTSKVGNSGALLDLRYMDAVGATIGAASSVAYAAAGTAGRRTKMLTASNLPPALAKPAGAVWLGVVLRLNAPAVGDYVEFFSPTLNRGQTGAATKTNRLASAFTAGPASILLRRTKTLYVSQDGLITNLGDTFNRISTVEQAYALAVANEYTSLRVICMRGGTNRIPTVGLGNTLAIPDFEVLCEPGVVLDAGIRITGWTQTAGTTKVWQAPFVRDSSAVALNQLFLHGVPDVSMPVPTGTRNPLYGDSAYRLPSTRGKTTTATTLAPAKAELDAYPTGTFRMWYDTANNIVYAIMPGEDDPANYTVVAPRRYWNAVSSTNYLHPGHVRLQGLLEYSGLQGDGRRWEFDNFQTLMGQGHGWDPGCGYVDAKGFSSRGHGIDGCSPHAPLNGLSMQGRIETFLFADNLDEGESDHYRGCAYTYVDGDSEFNGAGGYTPAYGAETTLINCRSRSNMRNFVPGAYTAADGGLVLLNDNDHSATPTTCRAINYVSIDDYVGASTRVTGAGTARLILENPVVLDPYGYAYNMQQAGDTTYNASWRNTRGATFGNITNKVVPVIG